MKGHLRKGNFWFQWGKGEQETRLALGTLHAAEAVGKAWLRSRCDVALRRDGPTCGRSHLSSLGVTAAVAK